MKYHSTWAVRSVKAQEFVLFLLLLKMLLGFMQSSEDRETLKSIRGLVENYLVYYAQL